MNGSSYRSPGRNAGPRAGAWLLALALALAAGIAAGCKKQQGAIDPDERGKLRRIAENLEEAYATKALPPVTEPPRLGDRLDKWDDFRSCTVRTYVARKRDADRRQREGLPRSTRHASVGDETVEECAVQMAIANKDASICERLALDYRGPNGELPLSAVRCWDTRARIFGLPDECPVVWMPWDAPGRNPECLAMARRDQSLCAFADSPGRCRALVSRNSAGCSGADGAPDCEMAFEYWKDLIPGGFGPPLHDVAAARDKPLSATFDLKWEGNEHPHVRIEGPRSAAGISWPTGRTKPGWTEDTVKFWGATLPTEAVQVSWETGQPAIKLVFAPAGQISGTRKLEPPSPTAAATFIAVWSHDPAKFRRCQPDAQTTSELSFDAGEARPGSLVEGKVKAEKVACSDGTRLALNVTFRLLILDVR